MSDVDIVSTQQLEVALGYAVDEARALDCIEKAETYALDNTNPAIYKVRKARHVRGVIRAFVLMAARDLYVSQEISEDALSLLRPFTGPQPQQDRR